MEETDRRRDNRGNKRAAFAEVFLLTDTPPHGMTVSDWTVLRFRNFLWRFTSSELNDREQTELKTVSEDKSETGQKAGIKNMFDVSLKHYTLITTVIKSMRQINTTDQYRVFITEIHHAIIRIVK